MPHNQAIEYMRDHVTRLPLVALAESGACGVSSSPGRPRRSTGRSRAGAAPVVDRPLLRSTCWSLSPARASSPPSTPDHDAAVARAADHRHRRGRDDIRGDPYRGAGGSGHRRRAIGVASVATPAATADGRLAGTGRRPDTLAAAMYTSPRRMTVAPIRRIDATAAVDGTNTTPRTPSCSRRAARTTRLVDTALPALALRREPHRQRDPPPGRRRTGGPHRALPMIPAAVPGPGRVRCRPPSRCTRSSARARSARAVPHARTGGDRRGARCGVAVRHRVCNEKSIGTVVKYLGWKTPGSAAGAVCPPIRTRRSVESYRGR